MPRSGCQKPLVVRLPNHVHKPIAAMIMIGWKYPDLNGGLKRKTLHGDCLKRRHAGAIVG